MHAHHSDRHQMERNDIDFCTSFQQYMYPNIIFISSALSNETKLIEIRL